MNSKTLFLLLIQLILINSADAQTLIMNGLIATGKEGLSPFIGHILIGKNGKIINVIRETGLESNLLKEQNPNVDIIDAKNKIVVPGGIDPSVKFDFLEGKYNIESSDDFFTGTVSAVCGGTTTVIDVIEANLNERETMDEAIKKYINGCRRKVCGRLFISYDI